MARMVLLRMSFQLGAEDGMSRVAMQAVGIAAGISQVLPTDHSRKRFVT